MNRDERRFVNAKRLSRAACAALAAIALAACGGGGGGGDGDPKPPNDPPDGGVKPPVITSFSPTEGSVGAQVTVSGSNFGATADKNTVQFNGVDATVLRASPTELVAVVPEGATDGPLKVTTADGSAVSSSNFTVIPDDPGSVPKPPTITSFSPTEGPVGAQVVVSGSNFSETAAGITVTFNGVDATVLSASSTELVAVVPKGATSGPLRVVTTSGGSAVSSADFTVTPDPTSINWLTRTLGPGVSPNVTHAAIADNGTHFVVVGGDTFEASRYGSVWTTTRENSQANDVAWNGQIFVAVGSSSSVQTSPDGLSWTDRSLPSGNSSRLLAITAGPSLWVAVGEDGAIFSSPDGAHWSARSSTTTKNLVDVAWAANRFVAVGAEGAVVTSPDGLDWTLQKAPTTDSFTAVGGSSRLIVASTTYEGSGSLVLTSADAVKWSSPVLSDYTPLAGHFTSIIYAGDQFVATGSYRSATSVHGDVWTLGTPHHGVLKSVVYAADEYYAVGSDGGGVNTFFESSDGRIWSVAASAHSLNRVARSQDRRLIAVGDSHIRTSITNGATWTYDKFGDGFIDIVWSPSAGAFVGNIKVGADQYAYTSLMGGGAWSKRGYMHCNGALAASPTRLVNVGASLLGACVGVSIDGDNWTSVTPPSSSIMRGVFWSGSQFVGVGDNGLIATSADGVTWTLRTSNVSATLYGGVGSDANLVVVGANGTILTSPDHGATWTQRASGVSSTLRRAVSNGSEFLVFDGGRSILRSSTGENWWIESTPYPEGVNDAVWLPDESRWLMVGAAGLAATSLP